LSSSRNKWKTIWNLPHLFKKSWLLLKNPVTPLGRKLILLLLGLGYVIWPLDFIPDIPIVGQIDDLGIVFLLLNWFVNKSNIDTDSIEADYYYIDDEENSKDK